MDFLKAEIERKRKQLETSGLAPENKKYFSRRDLVTKNEEEYLRRSGLIRVSESDSSAKGEGENSSSEVQGRSGEHVREKSEKSSSEESQPILPRKEVIRRLRERSEPIRLFGENDGDAFERLKTLEIQRPEVIKGFRNDFKAAMDRVDKAYLDEILKQTGKDQEANDATEEGEGGESSTEAKDSKQSGATSTDKVMTLEEIQELAKDMGKGNESIDGRVILSFFQLILRKWDEEIKTAKKEGMMEVKNKMAAATHAQTVQYLRPLFARLRKCKLFPMSLMMKFRLALVQVAVTSNKAKNVEHTVEMIRKAVAGPQASSQQLCPGKADMIVLPEVFNSPFGNKYFPEYAEPIPGESTNALSAVASEMGIYLIGGSIPERDPEGKLFNTCMVFNPKGEVVAKHRKVHLFDIDIPGKITFRESDTLAPGNSMTTFDTPWCKVGLGICYDIRFAQMAQKYTSQGCKLLVYPGAFNMTTGPAHWQLLNRARALDNQVYCVSVSPARDDAADYNAWGHSICVDPWGSVLCEAEEKEEILWADIDLEHLETVRSQIPLRLQKRPDLYD
ncbi:unnamed protein product [Cyprideis torosa]|uniref:omega-amidase n=1 Tax=Cyprideis torosa TaxID=163714 RepID=A0A7R8WDQ1_9CRUS|nr:unnamed protein product [Cyprideis torosa]CAG0894897.1 unnamed protein product [Cyprideis torosa]